MALFSRKRFDPASLVGTSLPDRTALIAHLGGGAFSHVYEGKTERGERIAVKVLTDRSEAATKRFARELKVLELIGVNRHVVRFLGRGTTHDGLPYALLEFLGGYTLRSLLDSGHRLDEASALTLLRQLCEAFAAIHRLGLAHGDVCPSNIMVTDDGKRAKLIDFGLAQDAQGLLRLMEEERLVEGQHFNEDLDAGLLLGTPAYLAPEQIEDALEPGDKRKTDTPADVYALGVVMYELITGDNPHPFEFDAARPSPNRIKDYCRARLDARHAQLPRPAISEGFWSVLQATMHPDPRTRIGDARQLESLLDDHVRARRAGRPGRVSGLRHIPTWRPHPTGVDTIQQTAEHPVAQPEEAPGRPRWLALVGLVAGIAAAAALISAFT